MTPAVKGSKLSRARIMWSKDSSYEANLSTISLFRDAPDRAQRRAYKESPIVCLSGFTATAAREFTKAWEMETDEQIEYLAKKLSSFSGEPKWYSLKPQDRLYYRRLAMDALCALHFNTGEK